LARSWQKVGKKLAKSWQKVGKKLAKSWQKVSKLKICQSPDKVTTAENSETVRGRRRRRGRGRGRRFVVSRPGATLSHLVKMLIKGCFIRACYSIVNYDLNKQIRQVNQPHCYLAHISSSKTKIQSIFSLH
jgi:hypothetical protein